jgi:hypothetical protein
VLAGLIIMPPQNGLPERPTPFPVVDPSAYGADTAGFVGTAVDVEWRQLEPAPGQYDWRALDANLAAVSQYNAAHPGHTLGVKVRIFPGFVAPGWAKDLGGAPVTVPLANGRTNTVGHWWSPAYEAAWSTFLHAAAARYDANPLVDGVQVSSCSAITDEPFIMSPLEATALRAAGLTVPAYEHCLSDVFDDYSGWRQTPVYFPINGMPMTAHGSTFAMQIADQCATSASNGGVRCVIDNHGLGSPSGRGAWLYTTIDQLHQQSPGTTYVALQPYGPHDGPDCPAIAAAIAAHAQSVELWAPVPGGYPGFAADSPTTLATWTADLRSGTAPTC